MRPCKFCPPTPCRSAPTFSVPNVIPTTHKQQSVLSPKHTRRVSHHHSCSARVRRTSLSISSLVSAFHSFPQRTGGTHPLSAPCGTAYSKFLSSRTCNSVVSLVASHLISIGFLHWSLIILVRAAAVLQPGIVKIHFGARFVCVCVVDPVWMWARGDGRNLTR